MMKLLFLSSDPEIVNPNSEVAQRMVEYGNLCDRIDILALLRKGHSPVQLSAKVTVRAFSGRWLRFWRAHRYARRLPADSYDVITAQDVEHGFLAWFWSRRWGIPWQMQLHTDIFSPYFRRQSFFNYLRVILAKFLIPRADCTRVVSWRIKNSLDLRFKIKDLRVAVLPIFVDIQKISRMPIITDLHQKYPGHEKIILVASRLTKEKNIGLAIKAIREVVKEHPKTLLLIVGSGPEEKKLKAKTQKLKANIIFEPAVHFETLISYYKTADLYLLTSNYEGYGRTLIEAAAAGTPVITTDVGIAVELEGVRIVPVGDALRLRQAIIESISNPPPVPRLPARPTRDEYFARIKELWETCGKR